MSIYSGKIGSMEKGILFILSGPSGAGKTTAGSSLVNLVGSDKLKRIITTTTRRPRKKEVNGVDYFFTTKSDFVKKIESGCFLEHAVINDEYYGSSRDTVIDVINSGTDALLIIDVNGVEQILKIRDQLPFQIVTIFLYLADIDKLRDRIMKRGSENESTLAKRLNTAKEEIAKIPMYDFVIESVTPDEDLAAVSKIYFSKKQLS